MTKYTVVWLPTAEDQLAEIYLLATDRRAITAASFQIDVELAVNPATKGIPLAEGLRQLPVPPIKAFFEVHEPDRMVKVTAIAKA